MDETRTYLVSRAEYEIPAEDIPGDCCSLCFRLPPPAERRAFLLNREQLSGCAELAWLPRGVHVFCWGEATAGCDEIVARMKEVTRRDVRNDTPVR